MTIGSTSIPELLGLSQSTVSRALASAVVGTGLLIRDGRGVGLTAAAKTLLPYVDSALAEFQAGLDLVRHARERFAAATRRQVSS